MPGTGSRSRRERNRGRTRQIRSRGRRAPSGKPAWTLRLRSGQAHEAPVAPSNFLVAPDFLRGVGAVAGRRGKPRLYVCVGRGYGNGRGYGGCRCCGGWFLLGAYFVSAEITVFVLGGSHFWHGGIGFRVVVIGVPEKKAYAAFLFRYLYLYFNILGRVSLGAPGEGLQPGADHHIAVFRDELEAVHGLADEMLGRVAGAGDAVHAEEVRGIDHGREHVTVPGHGYDVLAGVREIDLTLPGHDSEDVE